MQRCRLSKETSYSVTTAVTTNDDGISVVPFSAQRTRTVLSVESDSVMFYYYVVNLLRIVTHYLKIVNHY